MCSADERESVAPPVAGSSDTSPTVGAFVDMLSRHNYVYLQPYVAGTDSRPSDDPVTADTASLTDLLGRAAALPNAAAAAGQLTPTTAGRLISPTSTPGGSLIVSKVSPGTPTMFRIVGANPPHQIMAYRHPPAEHADLQPVMLPASAVRPSSVVSALAVRMPPSSMVAHQVPVDDQGRVQEACEVDVGRVEAEAHELTVDSSGREIHRCRLCSRIFTVLSAFRSHVLAAHCRPKNQCAVCGKHFSRSWLLKGHMRTHTGERPYRCPHAGCDRAFADKSNLRSHLLIHNASGKHYVCSRCNRAFAQKRYLHKHRLEVCKI